MGGWGVPHVSPVQGKYWYRSVGRILGRVPIDERLIDTLLTYLLVFTIRIHPVYLDVSIKDVLFQSLDLTAESVS